jgi:hypothetical protein
MMTAKLAAFAYPGNDPMPEELRRRLVDLYVDLAAHTESECSGRCRRPFSCCAEQYCAFAIEFARDDWGVELQPTWHKALPLMGPDGCTAAPHLRPMCTAHTCEICEHGSKPGDAAWTRRYYELVDAIAEIEAQVLPSKARPSGTHARPG